MLDPEVPLSIGRYKIHSEGHLRDRDQLEIALPVLAHDTDVVVQPQPFVLDGERESSADDLEVELEGDTFIKASASTAEPDLGKEGSFPKSTDAEGLLGKVENDNELPTLVVSS